ncbi:MAG: hypothetical protein KJ687_09675 [Proteobacteria bacterium]|nr:hypothetical protein [Pseudomonadota bacterium]
MVNESEFDELCRVIGLAILMSQKLQYALAHYHALHKMTNMGMSKVDAEKLIAKLLSKTLGGVVAAVKSETPLGQNLTEKLDALLKERNWLAHDFDIEATSVIAAGGEFGHFTERMNGISRNAHAAIVELDEAGKTMAPSRANIEVNTEAER